MKNRMLSLCALLLAGCASLVAFPSPANADIAPDNRNCVTRAEWDTVHVSAAPTKAWVQAEFDTSGRTYTSGGGEETRLYTKCGSTSDEVAVAYRYHAATNTWNTYAKWDIAGGDWPGTPPTV